MVRDTLKALQQIMQDFESVSVDFRTLCSKVTAADIFCKE